MKSKSQRRICPLMLLTSSLDWFFDSWGFCRVLASNSELELCMRGRTLNFHNSRFGSCRGWSLGG